MRRFEVVQASSGSKKPRQARIPRQANPLLGMEDTSHLWAVSYADFLMVLLSFFVIFFSVNKSAKNNLILNIMTNVDKTKASDKSYMLSGNKKYYRNSSYNSLDTTQCSKNEDAGVSMLATLNVENNIVNYNTFSEKILQLYKNSHVKVNTEGGNRLVINLPDDSFHLGELDLNQSSNIELENLLKTLKPYKDKIKIGFVGHSDNKRVRQWKGRSISNNYDLSVMRASRTMSKALEQGFASEHLYAMGSGSSFRTTRSLSLIITMYTGDEL